MSIQDADCLGRCLEALPHDPVAALHKYQEERIPQTSQEVSHQKIWGSLQHLARAVINVPSSNRVTWAICQPLKGRECSLEPLTCGSYPLSGY